MINESTQPAAEISAAQAEWIAREKFGVSAHATRLNGEYDANVMLQLADGGRRLLRVSHPDEAPAFVDFQNRLLDHLASRGFSQAQRVMPTPDGASSIYDSGRIVRLFSWLPGRVLSGARPHTVTLMRSVGEMLGASDAALAGFSHPAAARSLKWDLSKAEWISAHLSALPTGARRELVARHLAHYEALVQPVLRTLRKSVIHNDANDHNLLISGHGYDARASGLIDFGDALHAPTVCNLAIALAYLMLGKRDPIATAQHVTGGYHAHHALQEAEIALLLPLATMRLCVSVVNSAIRKQESDDPYITISEAPAWQMLEQLEDVQPNLAHYKLRHACGLSPVSHAAEVCAWLDRHQAEFASVVNVDLRQEASKTLDLSVGSLDLGLPDEMAGSEIFAKYLQDRLGIHQFGDGAGKLPGIGRHNEPRLIYANDDFATVTEDGVEYRTVHIGLDVFQPAGSPVFAPLAGTVHSFADNVARLDYGPCIILAHQAADPMGRPLSFYTLYGHLSRASLAGLQIGQAIRRGQQIATMGDYPVNGDWPPHLHFQVITDMLGFTGTFPGVARPSDRDVWLSLSPDPNLIIGLPAGRLPVAVERGPEILARRKAVIGPSLSISYERPLTMVRGSGQYLYDELGRKYLDGYNNVPHVGHSHPHIVRAVQRQLAVLNTNTRYLNHELARYAERLVARMPAPRAGEAALDTVFLVTSGSEATELALRLARTYTGAQEVIVSDGAYHGHTSTLIEISPYKSEGPGGSGLPNWVHKAPVPDTFRGPHRGQDAGAHYAAGVANQIADIQVAGRNLCAFIIESIPSVGGQIVLPEGYLPAVYAAVRLAGGVCMADEVQTGFGRTGKFWAFEHYGVLPDIVALGKPIGNGYPMGAVITTRAIAERFDNGMEFFSTFGGSNAACAAGNAVLDVVEQEALMPHAAALGELFMQGLRALQARHPIIGDVRGLGLMLGVELINPGQRPAPAQASYVANRMKDKGILIGTDGIDHNVLKIRGPMCFTTTDVGHFVDTLEIVLREDASQPA